MLKFSFLAMLCLPSAGFAQSTPPPADMPTGDALATAPTLTAPTGTERANENAVRQAADAFGISIGREEIGLYSSSDIRGFSPIDAGNARIDGLFFDQYLRPITRIRQSTNIRVGLAAQGFLFPAPTGVVDYVLRKPGNEAGASAIVNSDSWGTIQAEVDATIPLVRDRLSLQAGAFVSRQEYYNNTDEDADQQGLALRWTPAPGIAIMPFWSRSASRRDEAGQIYVQSGPTLPARVPRRRYVGPLWAYNTGTGKLRGATALISLDDSTELAVGAFRSSFDDERSAANLVLDVQPDGSFDQRVFLDPPSRYSSDSGEIRLTRVLRESEREHRLHFSLRGRDRFQRYDGSAVLDLGRGSFDTPNADPEPVTFRFREQSRNRIKQWTGGFAYELRWTGIGEFGIGLQRTDYRKRVTRPDTGIANVRSEAWLPYASAAVRLADPLVAYASFAKGLEDSGVAPSNAINRGQPVPAIRTRQIDGGVRWAINPGLKLVLGAFDLQKPYFNIDRSNRFVELGQTRNRGVEISLSGAITSRLDVVAGGVFLNSRVSGEAVNTGGLGTRPVGFVARNLTFNLDWRPTANPDLTTDIRITHRSEVTATTDNLARIPPLTLVDIGARFPFQIARKSAALRLSVANLLDTFGWELRGAGAYDIVGGRLVEARLTVDF